MANNLGIALGAAVDQLNAQRRMAMAEDEASRQKEQFDWARTEQQRRQAIKAAQAQVLSDAGKIRKQYEGGDIYGASDALARAHSNSDWDGGATSQAVRGLGGKVYAIRNTGKPGELSSPNDIERREVTPELFSSTLDSYIAHRMMQVDPDNYLQNSRELRKIKQGDEQLELTRRGQTLTSETADKDRTSREATSAEERALQRLGIEQTGRYQQGSLANQAKEIGLRAAEIANRNKQIDLENNRYLSTARATAEQRDYDRRKDGLGEAGKQVDIYMKAFDDPKVEAQERANFQRYLTRNFDTGTGADAGKITAQALTEYSLERNLNEGGQHWFTPERPADMSKKSMWVLRKSTPGDALRFGGTSGDYRFENPETGQVVGMNFINRLPATEKAAFLGGYEKNSKGEHVYVPGRVIDESGRPMNVGAILAGDADARATASADAAQRTPSRGLRSAKGLARFGDPGIMGD
jgi:hypothetical protein